MLVWVATKEGLSYLRLLRLSNGEVLFEEELYENFDQTYVCKKTQDGSHHFHIMEFEDYMAGACFAEEKDAKQFEQMMPVMASGLPPSARRHSSPGVPPGPVSRSSGQAGVLTNRWRLLADSVRGPLSFDMGATVQVAQAW